MDKSKSLFAIILLSSMVIPFSVMQAEAAIPACLAPEAAGTVFGPIHSCDFHTIDPIVISQGLPAGNTIEIQAIFVPAKPPVVNPGGGLGGEQEITTEIIEMQLTGTGPAPIGNLNRLISMPSPVKIADSAPRIPFDPVQPFPTELILFDASVFGDPDFDLINLKIGNGLGAPPLPPSPGQTTLTDLGGGQFQVDSFFDIHYEITFQGAPGSILQGMSGTTQGAAQIQEEPNGMMPDPNTPIGGSSVPIDQSALLLAGVQSVSMWMIPVLAGIGIGVFVIKRRK